MPVYKVSEAQQRVLDRMGDGYRLVQQQACRPHLVKDGVHHIETNRSTIDMLVEKGMLTVQENKKMGSREWVIVPHMVYNQTCICPSCGGTMFSRQTGPRSFKCLACQYAWTKERR